MTIYDVRFDIDRYQYLLSDEGDRHKPGDLIFDCEVRAEAWNPPKVYIANPKAVRGDFLNMCTGGYFICTEKVRDELDYLFYPCAELLPLPCGNEMFYIVNVLRCLNILDEKRSVFGGVFPKKYIFHTHRMQAQPLFKIPRTSVGQVLTSQGVLEEEYDFKLQVEQRGFKGLTFKRVWSDEGE